MSYKRPMETAITLNKERLAELRELKDKSTHVVGWYPHSQYDGYHPGKASVRGPFGRWLLVEGGERGTSDGQLGQGVADLFDDAKFAAAAMNSLGALLDMVDTKDRHIQTLRECVRQLSRPDLGDIERDIWSAYRNVRDESDHLRSELDRKKQQLHQKDDELKLAEARHVELGNMVFELSKKLELTQQGKVEA